MSFHGCHIFLLNRPPMFAILRASKREHRQKSGKIVGSLLTGCLNSLAKKPDRKRKAPAFVSRLLLAAFCFKNGLFWRSRRDSNARRSAQETKTGLSSNTPQMPANACQYYVSNKFDCSRFLQKTPLLPQCDQQEISRANFGGRTFSHSVRQNQPDDRYHFSKNAIKSKENIQYY